MPFKGNDFQHTRSEAYSALTYDKYGHEHDEAMDGLVDVENGVRKYWADQLRTLIQDGSQGSLADLANLLDPYSGDDGGNNEFARTTLDDRPEGAKHITPNDED
jgi:hypothetical protein